MDYYVINTCPTVDVATLAFIDYVPDGTAAYAHRMSGGHAMGDKYPAEARIQLQKKSPGTKLSSLLGNTDQLLIVERRLKDLFAATGIPMECLNFALYDHKNKLLSRDYFIINVLGAFDAIDQKKSKIEYEGDDIVGIDKLVLDPKKLAAAPDLFRLEEARHEYFISARLAKQVQALKPTNVYLKTIAELRT